MDISFNSKTEFTDFLLHTSPHTVCEKFVLFFRCNFTISILNNDYKILLHCQSSICNYDQLLVLYYGFFLFQSFTTLAPLCMIPCIEWRHVIYILKSLKTSCTLLVDTLNGNIYYNKFAEIIQSIKGLNFFLWMAIQLY